MSARAWIVLVSGAATAWVAITLGVARWWATREVAARAVRSRRGGRAVGPGRSLGPHALVVVALGRRGRDGGLLRRMAGLAGAAGLAGDLAGVQLVPALEFLCLSTRAGGDPTIRNRRVQPRTSVWSSYLAEGVPGARLEPRWVGLVPPRHIVEVWTPRSTSAGWQGCSRSDGAAPNGARPGGDGSARWRWSVSC